MVAKDYQKAKGLSKAEVGEIDTSAPFQSVKAAVSLFGEGAFSGERPAIRKIKPQSADRVLAKETQLHLTHKELTKLREQLENAESTKSQALLELENAKRTMKDLTEKLNSITLSKDSAIMATEASKNQGKQFTEAKSENSKESSELSNSDLESAKARYISAASELDVAKQELRKIRQEYDASIEAKNTATRLATEAENAIKGNSGKFDELSEEIASVQDSVHEVKFAIVQVKEEETKTCAEKDKQKLTYKARLQEIEKELLALKKNIDPEVRKNLESQLSETLTETETLRNEIENAKSVDCESVKTVTSGLDGAKESLQKLAEEENSLRSLVETLKLDLDSLKKEHAELKEKESETENIAGNLHVKLRKAKSELEDASVQEAQVRSTSDEMIANIHRLVSERETVKQEAEKMKQQTNELKQEVEISRIELEKAEKSLKLALVEVEEAKFAESKALDQIKLLSEKTDAARTSVSEPGAQITISKDEFDSLSRKAGESETLAEMKVAAALAQVEALKASENELLKKLESSRKEIDEMKIATNEALKKAEMAEAARNAVEGELRRWREREDKKKMEAASMVLLENEKSENKSFQLSPYGYHMEKPRVQEKVESRKLEKAKTAVGKKVLMPSLSGVFQKKKKNVVDGGSPSYLPGEKSLW